MPKARSTPEDLPLGSRRQVVVASAVRMVAMAMRDHRTVDGTPGVEVEVARRAVESLGTGDDKVHGLSEMRRRYAAVDINARGAGPEMDAVPAKCDL